MDQQRFDRLARAWANRLSRRRFLAGTAGGVVAGSLLVSSTGAQCPEGQVERRGRGCVCRSTGRPPEPEGCPCESGLTNCAGVCVDTARDELNCGGCDVVCATDQRCRRGSCEATCGAPAADCVANADCCNGACTCGGTPAGICDAGYFEGFDAGVGTWSGGISASGGVGIVAMDGSALTSLGGYNSVFPAGGIFASIDMFLDMSLATGSNDVRLDYSVAINDPTCTHRRDFVFHVGTDPTTASQFAISASNNTPGWPSNPGRSPLFVAATGWYTFTHSFYDAGGGVLAVDLCVSGPGGSSCWTLSDASDVIGSTIGGNRYGWFVTNKFTSWQIDNVSRS